jgi:hypothetical protein
METGKGSLVGASRKHRQCSRFLGRRLVQSNRHFSVRLALIRSPVSFLRLSGPKFRS